VNISTHCPENASEYSDRDLTIFRNHFLVTKIEYCEIPLIIIWFDSKVLFCMSVVFP